MDHDTISRLTNALVTHDLATDKETLGIKTFPEAARRTEIVKGLTEQGGGLANDATKLASAFIDRASEISDLYPSTHAYTLHPIGYAQHALHNAATNPDISDKDVEAGYKNVLEKMKGYAEKFDIAPYDSQRGVIKQIFRQMQAQHEAITKDPVRARAAMKKDVFIGSGYTNAIAKPAA